MWSYEGMILVALSRCFVWDFSRNSLFKILITSAVQGGILNAVSKKQLSAIH